MNKLYDALEDDLEVLEQGQTLDAALARHPEFAQALRPTLDASLQARTLSRKRISTHYQRRGRSQLLWRAAELRESRRTPRRSFLPLFPRLIIMFGMVGAFALSGTGLSNAFASTLPGDQLYPAKLAWENARLSFEFSSQGRDSLESRYQQERLDEVKQLLIQGRAAPIIFSGLLIELPDRSWLVSGIPVSVTSSTRLPVVKITNSAPVTVVGIARTDGVIVAEEIQLLEPGVLLPPLAPSDGKGESRNVNNSSIPTPSIVSTSEVSQPEYQPYEFSGVVESMQDNVWKINGQTVYVDQEAQIVGKVRIGSIVKFRGYSDVNGKFTVASVQVIPDEDDSSILGHDDGSSSSTNPSTSSPVFSSPDSSTSRHPANPPSTPPADGSRYQSHNHDIDLDIGNK